MKSIIIKQKTRDGMQTIFHIKELKNGEYEAKVLKDLQHLIEITIINNKNSRIKI